MAKHLELLLAIDAYTREHPNGYVSQSIDIYTIARDAGLAAWGDTSPATWTGELVEAGYLTHAPLLLPDPHPALRGAMWSDHDLQRFHDYRVTPTGREEADRTRRIAREAATDSALDARRASLLKPWMNDAQRHAIGDPLHRLRTALDAEHWTTAVGAAKDLAEAACKLTIQHAGRELPANTSLPTLFKHAHRANAVNAEEPDSDLGRTLAALAQRLAELRNTTGAGHGHAELPQTTARHARLAASAGTALADFLLTPKT